MIYRDEYTRQRMPTANPRMLKRRNVLFLNIDLATFLNVPEFIVTSLIWKTIT
jgi:hypothetical protein